MYMCVYIYIYIMIMIIIVIINYHYYYHYIIVPQAMPSVVSAAAALLGGLAGLEQRPAQKSKSDNLEIQIEIQKCSLASPFWCFYLIGSSSLMAPRRPGRPGAEAGADKYFRIYSTIVFMYICINKYICVYIYIYIHTYIIYIYIYHGLAGLEQRLTITQLFKPHAMLLQIIMPLLKLMNLRNIVNFQKCNGPVGPEQRPAQKFENNNSET